MNAKSQFAALEIMCRERAAVARKEMEYWQEEAEEWKRLGGARNQAVAEFERSRLETFAAA
jgi:hypothetical protein